jgi:hypothetical protein
MAYFSTLVIKPDLRDEQLSLSSIFGGEGWGEEAAPRRQCPDAPVVSRRQFLSKTFFTALVKLCRVQTTYER